MSKSIASIVALAGDTHAATAAALAGLEKAFIQLTGHGQKTPFIDTMAELASIAENSRGKRKALAQSLAAIVNDQYTVALAAHKGKEKVTFDGATVKAALDEAMAASLAKKERTAEQVEQAAAKREAKQQAAISNAISVMELVPESEVKTLEQRLEIMSSAYDALEAENAELTARLEEMTVYVAMLESKAKKAA